jgi:hypothetical protein
MGEHLKVRESSPVMWDGPPTNDEDKAIGKSERQSRKRLRSEEGAD